MSIADRMAQAHMLYSLRLNWWKVTRPAMASMLPVPLRYYVPGRIRDAYQPRLETAELWDVPGKEQEEDEDRMSSLRRDRRKKKESKAQKFKRVFEREKVSSCTRIDDLCLIVPRSQRKPVLSFQVMPYC